MRRASRSFPLFPALFSVQINQNAMDSFSAMQYKPFGTLLVATTIHCIAACGEEAINGLYGVVIVFLESEDLMLGGDDLFLSSILVSTQTSSTIILRNPSTHHSTTPYLASQTGPDET
jgi:hypothetical protein